LEDLRAESNLRLRIPALVVAIHDRAIDSLDGVRNPSSARRIAPGLVRELALDVLHVRAGEQSTDRSVDDLLAYAVATETRLRFFRSDVIVFAGASCALARVDELRAARLALAARIEDLFGVAVCGAPRDDAAPVAPVAAPPLTTDRPADVVLPPWEVDAESIPPAQSSRAPIVSRSPRHSRLPEVGDPPPLPRPRGGARDSNVSPRQDDPTASQETPQ
jgi:hypothetical protein